MAIPETMRAIAISEPGGPEVLVPAEDPVPEIGEYDVLVRVMAVDGHIDRRERLKISNICNNMNISHYERNYLINRASGSRKASPNR